MLSKLKSEIKKVFFVYIWKGRNCHFVIKGKGTLIKRAF